MNNMISDQDIISYVDTGSDLNCMIRNMKRDGEEFSEEEIRTHVQNMVERNILAVGKSGHSNHFLMVRNTSGQPTRSLHSK